MLAAHRSRAWHACSAIERSCDRGATSSRRYRVVETNTLSDADWSAYYHE
jgi:hypothetical protein